MIDSAGALEYERENINVDVLYNDEDVPLR